jgi:hypothetical protein
MQTSSNVVVEVRRRKRRRSQPTRPPATVQVTVDLGTTSWTHVVTIDSPAALLDVLAGDVARIFGGA